MENLAYFHLALAHETPIDAEYAVLISTWESLGQLMQDSLDWVCHQPKLSTRAAISLLSLSLAFGSLGIADSAGAVVREGDRGAEVTQVQERLQELGYFQANVTGYFGSLTKEAVIEFQQSKGLEPDGIVGTNTLVALGGQSKPASRPAKKPRSQPQSNSKPTRQSSVRYLKLGSQGPQVSALQESLAVGGFYRGSANGVFDEATQKAVVRFQQAKGLLVDGIVGPQTRAALPSVGGTNPPAPRRTTARVRRSTNKKTTASASRSTRRNRSTAQTTPSRTTSRTARTQTAAATVNRLQTSDNSLSPAATQALQKRLKDLGFYKGEIDGIWGPLTQSAVEAAQRVYGINSADIRRETS
jgi:peptidoglycan hydrolase-like protein with peptidoglycan-binding domain